MNLLELCGRGAFSMWLVSLVALPTTPLVASADEASSIVHTYQVEITPLSDQFEVSGYAVLFSTQESHDNEEASATFLGYAGKVENIEANLTDASCTAENGCGVHVHSGKSCLNRTTQGGHYYNNATIAVDPWIDARYFTNDDGNSSSFSGLLNIGSADIEGRAFIVHSSNGTRIGCGIIEKVNDDGILSTVTTELADSGVTSQVSLYTMGDGVVCYFGTATSLERELISSRNPDSFLQGKDCNFTNGCGVHVHNGTSCSDSKSQGGHFYGDVAIDPWLYTMYYSTDEEGEAYYTGCVETGISDDSMFSDRPFIVHSNNGSRVSCGILQVSAVPSPTAPSTPTMPTAPTPTMPTVPTPTMSSAPSTSHATALLATVNFGIIMTVLLGSMLL